MIFKYEDYKKFLGYLKGAGNIVPLCEWDTAKAIILRHDVDFDVECAYRLAQVEAECGIRSTYLFLTTRHTYNPFSVENRHKISKIAELGFEIGLHFDPTVYGDVSENQLKVFVDQESELLSVITGVPVRSVSLHNPSVHGQYPLFDAYNNAYDKRIFSDEVYLADSRMNFHGKNPYAFFEQISKYPVQILLHPLHYSENGLSYPDICYEHLKRYTDEIDSSFRGNSTYKMQISQNDLFSYIVQKGRG